MRRRQGCIGSVVLAGVLVALPASGCLLKDGSPPGAATKKADTESHSIKKMPYPRDTAQRHTSKVPEDVHKFSALEVAFAEAEIADGQREAARERLHDLIRNYPGTDAAREGKAILKAEFGED